MANPIFIAVNRTASPILLPKLALTVPASGQVTLSDYNTAVEIQSDEVLKAAITSDYLYINDGTNTLNKDQSLAYCSTPAVTTDVGDYCNDAASSGVLEGGIVTATGGNGISVSAGSGLCVRGDPYNDVVKVSWGVTNFSLAVNTYYYVYYDFSSGAVIASGAQRIGEDIQLAQVRSDGTNVRFLHRTRTPVLHPSKVLDEYLIDTRRIALVTGLEASAGTTGRKFQIAAGSYYRALDEITFAGTGGDATFSAFYGTNGANEVSGQTEINITQYDNAGTLTAMTAGYWRADSLIITSDGRVSVIFGTAQYATEALAEAASFAAIPGMMNSTACTIAQLLVQQGSGITKFVDARPCTTTNVAGSSGVTDHGALSGLADDDHPQYLPITGGRSMTGALNMGGQNISNIGAVAMDLSKYQRALAADGRGSNTQTSTTSTTEVPMADMSYDYPYDDNRLLVIAGGDLKNDTIGQGCEISLYFMGAKQAPTIRSIEPGSKGYVYDTFCIAAVLPGWNGAIAVYWKTNGGTLYCRNRYMVIIPICMP